MRLGFSRGKEARGGQDRSTNYIGCTSDLFVGMLATPLVVGAGGAPAGAEERVVGAVGYGFSDDGGRG